MYSGVLRIPLRKKKNFDYWSKRKETIGNVLWPIANTFAGKKRVLITGQKERKQAAQFVTVTDSAAYANYKIEAST
jgi:hypothetical protein